MRSAVDAAPGPWSRPSPLRGRVRGITFNIRFAREIDRAIALLIEDRDLQGADLVFLQEMDAPGTERIAAALGMHYVYYPATVHPGNGRDFGNAVLSRWPLRDEHKIVLPASRAHRALGAYRERVHRGRKRRTGPPLRRPRRATLHGKRERAARTDAGDHRRRQGRARARHRRR